METKDIICKICGNPKNNSKFTIKEMMYGFKDKFEYFECSNCGCLQILNPPKDLSKYYPSDYYSLKYQQDNVIKSFLKTQRDKYVVFKNNIIGYFLSKKFKPINLSRFSVLKKVGYSYNLNSQILDIGCGNGSSFLFPLKRLGFKNLFGVDPFISEDIEEENIFIFKKEITDFDENKKFDFITLFHSFEHLFDQEMVLKKIYNLLEHKGVCIIAIPLKSEFIWRKYGVDWVQIDAPRHFFLHTVKSLTILAKKVGLKLVYHYYDSTAFQFWGSEQYKKGIALISEKSYAVNPKNSIFSKNQIKEYGKLAEKLNKKESGDQAVFYFVKEC